jgi:hypothetical protein
MKRLCNQIGHIYIAVQKEDVVWLQCKYCGIHFEEKV